MNLNNIIGIMNLDNSIGIINVSNSLAFNNSGNKIWGRDSSVGKSLAFQSRYPCSNSGVGIDSVHPIHE